MVNVISPLSSSLGTHQISLRLHPEGLGTVDATVTVQAGHVVIELSSDNPAGRQALSSALPDLRDQLSSGGQQASVFMSDPNGGGSRGHNAYMTTSDHGSPGSPGDPADGAQQPSQIGPVAARTGLTQSIDLRL